ncbi:MAG: hypothetical protein NTW17_02870 [Candidatus Pacearchaeota archaeon]|nr:hypothetical protein [Candidatus Pacearchaeota archaeon]
MVIGELVSGLIEGYTGFLSVIPPFYQSFINLFFLAVLIMIYAIFIWKFHIFISHKNIFKLNLSKLGKYDKAERPFLAKITAAGLYLLEYIIIIPILVFFWFSVFALFMMLVLELELSVILFVSAAIVAAIRMTSYIPKYGESTSRELAKLLPFNLMAFALITPGFFNAERILSNFNEIGGFSSSVLNYLLFIIILETLLRFFEFIFSLFNLEDEDRQKGF